MRIWK